MRRRPVVRSRQSLPSLFRPRGLRLEWLEDRTVPSFTFSLADPTLVEGETTIGTVTRDGDLSQPGIVWLYTPNPLWANGPGPVIIPAGQATATFPVQAVDDVVPEGDLTTNLHAWLQNPSTSAYALLTVVDDDPQDPIAKSDGYDVNEDDTFSTEPFMGIAGSVLYNDSSPNGALTASLISGPSHGTLSLNPDGQFTYTPDPNFAGQDFFTYRATDPFGVSGQTIVTLFVWGTQDPIQLSTPSTQTTAEDTPVTFGTSTGNAITIADVDNNRVLVSLLANGGTGILTLPSTAGLIFPYADSVNNSPSITFYAANPAAANAALEGLVFTPGANFNGTASLSIDVQNVGNDPTAWPSDSVYATLSIAVTPVNDAPVAIDDPNSIYEPIYQVYEDETFTRSSPGVLMNDTDPDGDVFSAVLASGPTNGTVTLNPNGGFSYTPNLDYFGSDSFTYRAVDPAGLWSEATVSLTIEAMDDPVQLSMPGSQTTAEDTPITFGSAFGNAITVIDPESPRVLVDLFVSGGNGILTLQSTAGLEFPSPQSVNNSPTITFYADSPAEANAALEGLVLTPAANHTGSIWLSVYVRDESNIYPGPGPSDFGDVAITVSPVNDPPVAFDDANEWYEDSTLYGSNVLWNDTDPDNYPLSAVLVSGPSHGTLSLNPNGSFTYIPNPDYFGTDSFTYRATDGASQSNVATVSLTILGMDDTIQVTVPSTQTTAEDTPISFGTATGNAITIIDPESPRVQVNISAFGTLSLATTAGLEFPYPEAAGNNSSWIIFYANSPAVANAALDGLVFTPFPDDTGDDTGTITLILSVQDLSGVTYPAPEAWGEFQIAITPVNDPPIASADSYETNEDMTLTVAARGVLSNDTDIDSYPLTAVLVSGPAHGAVTLNNNGSFTYTPEANFSGQDSFTYRAVDGGGLSSEATVSLTVWQVNDSIQISAPGPQTTAEEAPLSFGSATGNAITIIEPESPRLAVSLLLYEGGILTLRSTDGLEFPFPENTNNSYCITFIADSPAEANAALEGLVFTPAVNQTGPVGLGITVFDMTPDAPWDEEYAEIAITVTPVNDAPVTVNDSYTTEAGEPFFATLGGGGHGLGVLMNDQDPDQDTLSAILVDGPSHGTLSFNPDGTFTYTAEATYSGTDSFTYRALDGALQSELATATITVTPRNMPPVSAADAYSVDEDGSLTVATPGMLGNDADPEGLSLSAYLETGALYGSVILFIDGGFTYTPPADYHGQDEFWYRAFDGARYGDPTRVVVTVNPVNDAPVATGDSYELDEDGTLSVPASGLLGNDGDLDGDALSAVLVSGPSHGTVALNADGGFSYTPNVNYFGTDSFTYRAVDPSGAESVATVSLTIRPMAEPPVALDDSYVATEDTPFSVVVPGTTTSLSMVSDPGDYIGQGLTYNYSLSTGTITIERNYDNGVSISYREPGFTHWWDFRFAAPDEGLLVPGLYTDAMRFPFQDAGHPGMDISGDGRGSNTLTGWFRVDEVAYGPSGEVLVFAATFEQHSEGFGPALRGQVYYNAGATTIGGVLLNDSHPEGNPLTSVLVDGPANGEVYLNSNGTFLYVPDADFAGVDSFRYKATDGTTDSNVATVTITVSGVNDAPVNVVPAAQTLVEDTTLTFSAANGNAIRLTDIDAGNGEIELRLSVNGFLTFPTTQGLTFVTGSNGGNIIVVRGTLSDLNNALEGLVFQPGANFTGSYSLQVRTDDLGTGGTGGARTDLDYVTLNITPVNDAPRNVVPLITPVATEDTPFTFSPAIWVTDPDQHDTGAYSRPIRVTIDFDAGSGTLTVTPRSGVTITGNGTAQVVLEGAVPYVSQVMQSLVFTPVANTNNATDPVQIRITTNDQANGGPGALTDTDTFAVQVTPVNDAPVFTLSAGDVSVPMNSGSRTRAGVASAVAGPASAVDELVSQTIGFEVSVTATTGSLAFSAPPAISADGTLSFTPAAGTWGTATVQVLARDSGGTANGGVDVSAVQTFTITVTNTAPVSGGLPAQSVAEDASTTSITLTGHFSDSEDDSTALTYSLIDNTNPALFGSVTVSGGVLTFTPAPNANGSATLTVRAIDPGGLTVDVPIAVTVNPVNDAPSFTAGTNVTASSSAGMPSFGGWASAMSTGPANEAGQSLTFTVSADNPLLFAVQPAIDPVTGALTFTPVAGASGLATVTVVLHDDGGIDGGGIDASAPATFTITLTPPAATPGMQVIGTDLVITGGNSADTITLSSGPGGSGVKVTGTLNGVSVNKTFKQTLTGIQIMTGAGNDSITISDSITLPTLVNAGAGVDNVKGGGGSDVIFGGAGDDTINAAGGDDTVDAGDGNDSVTGGLGRDLLWGGNGDDTIQGGDGNDFLIGGLGADSLYGQNGFDILVGGTVTVREPSTDSLRQVLTDWDVSLPGIHDTLRARLVVTDDPVSADHLEGGADTDWFWSWDPLDTLDLQAGEERN